MLKQKYVSAGTAVATFDYQDIASGTGYVLFYGGTLADGTASGSYVLSDNAFYADKVVTRTVANPSSWTKLIEEDFDVTFNLPRIIKGNALLTIPIGIKHAADGEEYMKYYGHVYKVSGGAEEFLVSGSSTIEVFTGVGAAAIARTNSTLLTLPITNFKKDDILRLTVQLVAKGGSTTYGFAHDPKNRNDDAAGAEIVIIPDGIDTIMEFHVPFRIDI